MSATGIGRQFASVAVVEARLRDGLGGGRGQLERSLQVVVLQRRLVDLRREGDLVLAVRLHRVEVFGPVGEGRVENVAAPIRRRIGVVPGAAAGREQQGREGWKAGRA
jgi:hypothetical protein